MSARICPCCGCDVALERARLDRTEGLKNRRRREAAGLSLREAARRVGISHAYLSHVERGLESPSDALRQRLANVLDAATPAGDASRSRRAS